MSGAVTQGRVRSLTGAARVAAVIGWPVSHSLSPRLHGYWLARHGVDGAYVPLAVRPDSLAQAVRALPHLGFVGANLTLPHKEGALDIVDSVSDAARLIGAINTLIIGSDGLIRGHNTDAEGYLASLLEAVPGFDGRRAVILGAGGAARAVAVALVEHRVTDLLISNRTEQRARELASHLNRHGAGSAAARAIPWPPRPSDLEGAALLVNTTSLGMVGQGPLTLALEGLPRSAAVSDIVYVPLQTPLLQEAAARGHPVCDGLGMLLHQARAGFEAWFGLCPDVTEDLRRHMLAGLQGE